jgi:hypothetical protein
MINSPYKGKKQKKRIRYEEKKTLSIWRLEKKREITAKLIQSKFYMWFIVK